MNVRVTMEVVSRCVLTQRDPTPAHVGMDTPLILTAEDALVILHIAALLSIKQS